MPKVLTQLSFVKLMTHVTTLSFVYGLGQGLEKITRFLLIPIYLRYLSPAEFGIVALARLSATFIAGLLTLCLESSITRYFYEWQKKGIERQAVGTLWMFTVIWGMLLTWVVVLLGEGLFNVLFSQVSFDPYIKISLWAVGLSSLIAVPRKLIRMQERAVLYTILSYSHVLLGLILTVYFVVHKDQGAVGILKASLVSNLVIALPYAAVTLGHCRLVISVPLLKECLQFCLPIVPGFFIKTLSSMADTFVLEKCVNVKDVGLYSIARNLSMLIGEMATAIKTAWIPFYIRVVNERDDYKQIICRSTTCYSAGMAFLCFGLAVFAREIIVFLGREAYIDAAAYIPMLVLANLISAHDGILECGILMAKRTKFLSIVPLVGTGCIVCLSLLLVPPLAAWGAVISMLVAAIISFGLLYRYSIRAYPIAFDSVAAAKMLLAGLFLFVISIWIETSKVMLPSVWGDGVAKGFLVILYGFILVSSVKANALSVRHGVLLNPR